MEIKGKKTWFDKESQKWVSEVPKSFWIGLNDCYTGEKLYSSDKVYCYFCSKWTLMWGMPISNPKIFIEHYGMYPIFNEFGYRYTKNPYNK